MKIKLLIFLSSFLLGSLSYKAQVVNIPDETFLEYILLYTTVDTNNDGQIQVSEAEAYTGLINLGNSAVKDLTGLQAFKNITSLNLTKSKITSLDISANTKLVSLFASNTLLTKIDITYNSALASLTADHNEYLTQIIVGTGHSALQYISAMFNKSVTALDVTSCPNLTNLYLVDNYISSIDLSKNPRLAELNLGANNLTTIDVSKNTRLTYLALGYNHLTNIDITKNTLLDTVIFSGNPISSIDLSKNIYMRQFIAIDNQIETIDVSMLDNLQYIYLAFTKIKNIDVSKNPNLIWVQASNTPNLEYINLQNGNNQNFLGFFATTSPSLKCIQVDNPSYSSTANLWEKDTTAVYASDCSTIMATENTTKSNNAITVYPNPARDVAYINGATEKVSLYSSTGQLISEYINVKQIDVSKLTKGIYILKIVSKADRSVKIQKLIKE